MAVPWMTLAPQGEHEDGTWDKAKTLSPFPGTLKDQVRARCAGEGANSPPHPHPTLSLVHGLQSTVRGSQGYEPLAEPGSLWEEALRGWRQPRQEAGMPHVLGPITDFVEI